MAVLDRWTHRHYTHGLSPALKLALLCGVAIAIMGLGGILTLAQTSSVTTAGYRLRQLEQTLQQRQAQLHLLEEETAEMASLARIQRDARQRLLMGPAKEYIYIEIAQPQPEIKRIPDRFLPASLPSREEERPWWKTALDLLPLP